MNCSSGIKRLPDCIGSATFQYHYNMGDKASHVTYPQAKLTLRCAKWVKLVMNESAWDN
jgi:hypothetical protein